MAIAWETLATIGTAEGVLELRRRRDDWLMVIDGRVLMNSFSRSSEEQLATMAVDKLAGRPLKRALCSGLGMGFTLRALLDAAPADARVDVIELNPIVVDWCRGPLGPATGVAIGDPRVRVEVRDVSDAIANAPAGAYDLLILDLYEGPNAATQASDDPFYSDAAIARAHRAIAPRGVFGVWSEDADAAFQRRMSSKFAVTKHSIGSGGRRHIVYLGVK
jgi:spermidine synthase|nr:hypothetical protein [Kofleriaceae bacterium]